MTPDSEIERLEPQVRSLTCEMKALRDETNSRFNLLIQIDLGNMAVTILSGVGIVVALVVTR